MEFIKYEIKKGDTLNSIAEKQGISVKELIRFHNENCGLTNIIIGSSIPLQLSFLILEKNNKKAFNEEERDRINYMARYRCEQINISRINNNVITLSANTYSEYLLKRDEIASNIFEVKLVDSTFNADPVIYEQGFDFALKLEKLRTPVVCSIDSSGRIDKIYNEDELRSRWENFRDNKLNSDPVYTQLRTQAPEQAKDLIITGNKEFSSMSDFAMTLDKNLFFHIIFRAIQGKKLEDYDLNQMSQIFPNVDLNTNVIKSLVKEDDNVEVYRLVGTLSKEKISNESLEIMYNEIYKPMIKYSFTEFDYIYRVNYTIDKSSGMLVEGRAALSEKIKNNYEILTEFNIKRVEL
ncbi:LysM peptidoglycan-binding domain-containing protein [Chryseobacterium sp. JK1]|uniref:LysM peptidoglycan-binding domain-containing protein n=1 Tax=Chryseobacterium sp. JK1 TaxID=874294 RepID=UPI003D683A50